MWLQVLKLIRICLFLIHWFDTFDACEAVENWCTPEAPYEDPLPPSELPLPYEHEKLSGITWKRPSQFLPPIPEPTQAQSSPSSAPVVVPELKAPAKKGGAAATSAAAKKGTAESEPVKKAPPKHAHVRIRIFTKQRTSRMSIIKYQGRDTFVWYH